MQSQAEIIRKHLQNIESNAVARFARPVLNQIFEALPVSFDFHKASGTAATERITRSAQIVIIVDTVIETAAACGFGLAKVGEFSLAFTGKHWETIENEEVAGFLSECAARLGVDPMMARFHLFRESLLKQFLATAYAPASTHSVGVVFVNFANGTLPVVDGIPSELRSHSASDNLRYLLPFDFDVKAKCPQFLEFLDEVLPDVELQAVLAEFVGYVFAPSLKLEKALIAYGSGANGKSVVFDVVRALLGGDNVSHYALSSLATDYFRAMLANKLLNYASEISSKIEAETFKKLVSGEPVEARLPYGKPFILSNYARLAFNGNDLPHGVEHSDGFFRRFLVIPFTVTIPPDRRNPNLAREIIANELPGVMNWALAGLQRIIKQGAFSPCRASDEAVATYRLESDSVALFIADENLEADTTMGGAFTLREMYASYRTFCVECGYKSLGRNTFTKRLRALGFATDHREVGTVVHAIRGGGGR